jgi:hypothetical protein
MAFHAKIDHDGKCTLLVHAERVLVPWYPKQCVQESVFWGRCKVRSVEDKAPNVVYREITLPELLQDACKCIEGIRLIRQFSLDVFADSGFGVIRVTNPVVREHL